MRSRGTEKVSNLPKVAQLRGRMETPPQAVGVILLTRTLSSFSKLARSVPCTPTHIHTRAYHTHTLMHTPYTHPHKTHTHIFRAPTVLPF